MPSIVDVFGWLHWLKDNAGYPTSAAVAIAILFGLFYWFRYRPLKATKPTHVRTVLRLHFRGDGSVPTMIHDENIYRWFTLKSPSMELSEEGGTIPIMSVNEAWTLFVVFDRPVSYKQLTVSHSGSRLPPQLHQDSSPRSMVITWSGPIPAGDMEIYAKHS